MVNTMQWKGNVLILLDQTKLPKILDYIACYDYRRVAEAIASLEVRGAPAIGVAAAFAMVLGYKELLMYNLTGTELLKKLEAIKFDIIATRPTAVNLAWAVNKMWEIAVKGISLSSTDAVDKLENAAIEIYEEQKNCDKIIGEFGAALLPVYPVNVLTHCNAGALATCGIGTALGIVRQAYRDGKIKMVYADETRPLLQGARLTAWELQEDGIPVTLITDSMAAWTMKNNSIKAVIVGADRIAANGDVANKIGTFSVALAAREFDIPFYVAAPASTFDFTKASGDLIPIEERDADEVRMLNGIYSTMEDVPVFNPAFDVTPHSLITAIITEYGVIRAPFDEAITRLSKKTKENSHEKQYYSR